MVNKDKTLKYGVAGGIMGACLGVPGLGVIAGVAHANKSKVKKFIKSIDTYGGE